MSTGSDPFEGAMTTAARWLEDVRAEIGTTDVRLAHRVLRAWLHAVRDRLPVEAAAHLAAQLPVLLRGEFYEGWEPHQVPMKYHADELVARIAFEALVSEPDAGKYASMVTEALRRHLTPGLVDEILSDLPHDVRTALVPTRA